MAITTNGSAGTVLSVSADLAATISDESGTGAVVFNNSPTLLTPALGTPSALVLTNATGTPSSITLTNGTALPVSGITASTSAALGVGSVELGHATDTTIARVSAGVVSIEGVNVVTTSSTDTLTNKTLTSPVLTTPSISNINAAGDLIVGTADNTIGIIPIGTTGQTLTVAGGTATWATPAAGTTANDQAFAFAVQVFA
jgi:hypothetical protein